MVNRSGKRATGIPALVEIAAGEQILLSPYDETDVCAFQPTLKKYRQQE